MGGSRQDKTRLDYIRQDNTDNIRPTMRRNQMNLFLNPQSVIELAWNNT